MLHRKFIVSLSLSFLFIVCIFARPVWAQAASQRATLKQYISDLQKNPNDNALREKIIKHTQAMKPSPAIPEEARKYFVKAVTLQKDAKDVTGYGLAINAYSQSLLIAPWWPKAYYNLSLALESSGRFDDAVSCLKLYILTNPGAADRRAGQDRIYAIEAKKEMALAEEVAKKKAAEVAEAKAAEERKLREPNLEGFWATDANDSHSGYRLRRLSSGNYSASYEINGRPWPNNEVLSVRVEGKTLYLNIYSHVMADLSPDRDDQRISYVVSLSEDGNKLAGKMTMTSPNHLEYDWTLYRVK